MKKYLIYYTKVLDTETASLKRNSYITAILLLTSKKTGSSLYCLESAGKNFDGGHLTRTHKGAGHSVESKASHSAWIIKCHLTHSPLQMPYGAV